MGRQRVESLRGKEHICKFTNLNNDIRELYIKLSLNNCSFTNQLKTVLTKSPLLNFVFKPSYGAGCEVYFAKCTIAKCTLPSLI